MSGEIGTSGQPKLGPGRMVLVVGPSGAGKDTLMSALKARLADRDDVHFARRAITRITDGDAEDHASITWTEFNQLCETGNVALAWQAHELGYVIPKLYDERIAEGHTVIANGSRRVLAEASKKYSNVAALLITAPVDVLAERLSARGRETKGEIEKRLNRANLDVGDFKPVIRIENTGTVDAGVDAMIAGLAL